LLAILIPGVIQLVIGNVVDPLVMGESLDLHPVAIVVSLIFWGMIWGVVGMLLAAPIAAILKLLLERLELTRPLANLLAGRLGRPAPEG
jgi:AI-2 transport protein TqsA